MSMTNMVLSGVFTAWCLIKQRISLLLPSTQIFCSDTLNIHSYGPQLSPCEPWSPYYSCYFSHLITIHKPCRRNSVLMKPKIQWIQRTQPISDINTTQDTTHFRYKYQRKHNVFRLQMLQKSQQISVTNTTENVTQFHYKCQLLHGVSERKQYLFWQLSQEYKPYGWV
jgi:hypothetical protein